MTFKWSGDQEVLNNLQKLQKDANYMASYALNSSLFEARKDVQGKLPVWLEMTRGKNFITKSLIVNKANKQTLTAIIGFTDRLPLIHLMEQGGKRFPLKRTIPIPDAQDFGTKAPPKSKTPSKLLQRKDTFSGTVKGVSGIWQRKRTKKLDTVNLLYSYHKRTTYDGGNMHFYSTVQEVLNSSFEVKLRSAIEHVLRQQN